jgi:hypothetical protein
MPGLYEADAAVLRKDYGDELFVVESHEIPKLRLLSTGSKMTQMLQDWEAETRSRIGFAGVKDGEAVTSFNSQTQVPMVAYGTHQRESWKVTKVAGKVPTAGVKDQVKHQRKEALKRLRESMERSIGGTQEMQRGTSTLEYTHRGAFAWLIASLQSVQTVDSSVMPASGSVHTDPLDELSATDFETMVEVAATQAGRAVSLQGFAGPKLKTAMSAWAQKTDFVATTAQALQSFNINQSEKKLVRMVNTFEFDHGMVEVMPDYNLCCDSTTGEDSTYTPYSGLFLDMNNWKKRFLQNVSEFDLPDDGSGTSGYADVLWMLKCGLPAGNLAVYTALAT